MAKYIQQLRRGWKGVDKEGNVVKDLDDWATYETQEKHQLPLEGELVLEYDNGIPRLKIGDGKREFSELPYMSIDSFILPKKISVTINASKWEQCGCTLGDGTTVDNRWSQVVTVDNATITSQSKVDLLPDADQLAIFHTKGLAFVAENNDGEVSVYCLGNVPTDNYTIQAMVTEVAING